MKLQPTQVAKKQKCTFDKDDCHTPTIHKMKMVQQEYTFATAVPDPIAIPMSAFFSAGASLTPSPVIATLSKKRNKLCNWTETKILHLTFRTKRNKGRKKLIDSINKNRIRLLLEKQKK